MKLIPRFYSIIDWLLFEKIKNLSKAQFCEPFASGATFLIEVIISLLCTRTLPQNKMEYTDIPTSRTWNDAVFVFPYILRTCAPFQHTCFQFILPYIEVEYTHIERQISTSSNIFNNSYVFRECFISELQKKVEAIKNIGYAFAS